ncbi:hypothetical protein PCAR4_540012 [Paraburkholderia caribensis]|nr:hypothetical protein PCAR4_540012 [Paraburkholderia caribensis]
MHRRCESGPLRLAGMGRAEHPQGYGHVPFVACERHTPTVRRRCANGEPTACTRSLRATSAPGLYA